MPDTTTRAREIRAELDKLAPCLAEVREREKAAIKGPWHVQMEGCDCGGEYGCRHGEYPWALHLPEPWKLQLADGTVAEPTDYNYVYSEISELPEPTANFIAEARTDVPRLLAAVEAVLAQHQPGRIVILGALCPRHEAHRHFSITSTEAADVVACHACSATVYDSCAGCGPQVRLDSCPARTAISGALLGDPNA